jgi:hypothetical protein
LVVCGRSRAIPLNLVFNACLGLAFAVVARDRIRADGPFAQPSFSVVLLFAGIILAPFTLYLYAAHGAWTWMYLVDPRRVPSLALIPLLVLHAGALVVGWYVGCRLVRANRAKQALYAAGGGAAAIALLVLVLWGRLGYYGTYGEWADERALPIMDVKLGYVLIALVLGVAMAAVLTALELARDSRRVKSR